MFRVSFFVRDGRLAETLKLVDGKCLNLEVQPVRVPEDEAQKYAFFPGGEPNEQPKPAKKARQEPLPAELGYSLAIHPKRTTQPNPGLRVDLQYAAPHIDRPRGTKIETKVADAVWHNLPEEFEVSSFKKQLQDAGLTKSVANNRLRRALERGTLKRVGFGRYRKVAA